jgi:DNA-binding beta-propeller fold protein YncE
MNLRQPLKKLPLILVLIFAANCHIHEVKKLLEPEYTVTTLADISIDTSKQGSTNQMPQGITIEGDNIYITDFFNHVIYRVSMITRKMEHFAGVFGVSGFNDGDAKSAMFYRPIGIAGSDGYLYVADSGNSVIRRISIATGQVSTFSGIPGVTGHLNGPPVKALLRFPAGVAIGANKNQKFLYVADTGNSTIRKIDMTTRHVGTLAGMAGVAGLSDGKGDSARLNSPRGIIADGNNIYVADTLNGAIRKVVIATGEVTTLAGKDFQPGGEDGVGPDARFNNPAGVTIMEGRVYIADSGNDKIRLIYPETGETVTIAGKHFQESNCPVLNLYRRLKARLIKEAISESADGVGLMSRFKSPGAITTDGKKLFVVDTKNHLIRVLQKP